MTTKKKRKRAIKLPTKEQLLGALPAVTAGLRILSAAAKKKKLAKGLSVAAALTEVIIQTRRIK